MAGVRRLVVDLASQRPVWQPPQAFLDALAAAGGKDWQVDVVRAASNSDGDGSGGSPEAVAVAAGAEVYIGWGIPEAVLEASRGTLGWVHTAAAGVAGSLRPALKASGAIFTNSAGVHADPIAEWVVAAVLHFFRGMDLARRAQDARRWAKDDFTGLPCVAREVAGSRVAVYGLGGIGRAVARRFTALGAVVRAVRRRPALGGLPGVATVGPGQSDWVLEGAAALVVTAPLTPGTKAAIGERQLGLLADGAVVVNVSRGQVVEEAALLAALDAGKVRGVALDVFDKEPLPPDHRYWTHPRVLVHPHVAAVTPLFWARQQELVLENWKRYREKRELLNVVDPSAGY
ncbi:MAG: D-2-hydroxyacid dehydrogenase [Gemmatimonadales bacterium]|jgi:phosphoglycerate dehydrogenase-like enzyme